MPTTPGASRRVELPYEHRQSGAITRAGIGMGIGITVVVLIQTEGGPPLWIASSVLVVLLLAFVAFGSLTTSVDRDRVAARFGPGWIHFDFDIVDIASARSVRNPWFVGWGIRWMPGTWIYNVSGLDAVEIELKSGKRYRLGTDEPAALEAAIRAALDPSSV
ncbi:MAG: hypothetical protein KDC38_13630 [Planctomycetes bacterium]|nr:hypothetical protein [Planctomycetota bacterium]